MLYKNEYIRKLYSFTFGLFVVGLCLLAVGFMLLAIGFIRAGTVCGNVHPVDKVLEGSGNHAVHAVYFEITEAPQKVGSDKYETYYLISDGNEYRISGMKKSEYDEIISQLSGAGSYQLQGMTSYIIDSNAKEEIAKNASEITGQNVTVDNMDDILGDVQIRYLKISYLTVLKEGYIVNLILGGMFFICGLVMSAGTGAELKLSRKVKSLCGITADKIDEEANRADSIWFEHLRVYATPDMLVGCTCELGNWTGQTAFKYNEIKRLYGYNKFSKENIIKSYNDTNKYCIVVEAIDGNKYFLTNVTSTAYDSGFLIGELNMLREIISKKAPDVKYSPENVKYKTFKFPYYLKNEEGEKGDIQLLESDELLKKEICESFEEANIAFRYPDGDAIVSLSMKFAEPGFVEITAGYFGDREQIIEGSLNEFLYRELSQEWGEDFCVDEYYLTFDQ